jgi:enoyl-CoA hydratase/carnithine racemase
VPTGGGPYWLARQLPLKQTMRLVLTASIIDAGQAHAMGLVNKVVAPGEHVEAALRLADEVLACAPAAVRALKQQVLSGLDRPLAEAMRVLSAYRRQRASADRKEGLAAFAERRSPHWTGR